MRDDSARRITVLGAGPAGIAAAHVLSAQTPHRIEVLERAAVAGGNAGSFELEGVRCDYGSHRFHPVADPAVLADVKSLLGDDLLLRPRHGRIRLGGRWIHFPLKPLDAIRRLPPRFAASLMGDMATKPLRRKNGAETFSQVIEAGLGPTIAESFYFPYVRKLWGLEPDQLAMTLAHRRVSAGSVGKILGKMVRMLPGFGDETTGRFYYPRRGFGQISEALVEAAKGRGTEFRLGVDVAAVTREGERITGLRLRQDDGTAPVETDLLLSTIPLTALVRLIDPPAPPEVLEAAARMRFRSMILLYVVLETDQFTEYDAHYFPELSVPISRLSEPKNYSAATEPRGTTVLCAELPCDPGERWWGMSDDDLAEAFRGWMAEVGLPVRAPIRRAVTRRLSHAYPVYDLGYERAFERIDGWLSGLDGLVNFGRQGLFAHDNTHHAFAMAYGAAGSIGPDVRLDREKWAEYRREFATHKVED